MSKLPIRLRSLRLTDLDDYASIVKSPQVARGAQFPLVHNKKQTKRMLSDDLKSDYHFAVTLPDRKNLIGVILLDATIGRHNAPDHHRLLLGYFMDPRWQGCGYMTLALRLIVQRMRCVKSVRQLVADVSENNGSSIRVLQKNGFVSNDSILNMDQNQADLIFKRDV